MFLPALKGILNLTGGTVGWSWRFKGTGYTKKMSLHYFKDEEVAGLDKELASKLDTARAAAGVPFVITSGLRSCSANQAALGVESSSHLVGKAVDLAVPGSRERFHMVRGLLAAGFTRIGIYDKHIHADVDTSKDPEVIWTGLSH